MSPAQKTALNSTPERALCLRCLRAKAVCFCGDIAPFRSAFDLILLQHPRERRNSIGTARLTHLCIENSRLYTGVSFENEASLQAHLDEPGRKAYVLFPGPDSINMSESPEAIERSSTVFVIDGTWSQAKTMLRHNPRIAALPRVSFTPGAPSDYRVRKQPHPHCLSTIEATHTLLELLDPQPQREILLSSFRRLVEQQLAFGALDRLREHSRSPRST